jgi:hypothetical protein
MTDQQYNTQQAAAQQGPPGPRASAAVTPAARPQQANQQANQQPSSRKKSLEDTMLVTRTPDEETEDGRIRNREAATKIRDAWIYKQIRLRQDEFTQYRTVRNKLTWTNLGHFSTFSPHRSMTIKSNSSNPLLEC